ncbi:MAG: hypothetical protein U1E53_14340 [Dongiaceae bacterium]
MANLSQLVDLYADLLGIPRRIVGRTAALLGREGLLPVGWRARWMTLGTGDAATLLLAAAWVGRTGRPSAAGARHYAGLPCRAIRIDAASEGPGQPAPALIAIERPFGAAALGTARRPEDLAALECPIYALSLAIWDAADPMAGQPPLLEIRIRRDPDRPAARFRRVLGAAGHVTAWHGREGPGQPGRRLPPDSGALREVVAIPGTVLPEIARLLTADDVLLSDPGLRWLPAVDLLSGAVPAPIDPAHPTAADIAAARAAADAPGRRGLLPRR